MHLLMLKVLYAFPRENSNLCRCLCEHAGIRARVLALQELSWFINEYLNLASHEPNTL